MSEVVLLFPRKQRRGRSCWVGTGVCFGAAQGRVVVAGNLLLLLLLLLLAGAGAAGAAVPAVSLCL